MKPKALIVLLALQSAVLLGMVAVHETRLHTGVIVHLDTEPVDPRDLLRGDYVILNYKISTLPVTLFATGIAKEQPIGTTVYVRLEKKGQFHQAQAASFAPLEGDAEHPVLQGKTTHSWWWGPGTGTNQSSVRVEYGLERYYVREGTGNPRGKLAADVSVASSGRAAIKEVYLDGKPYAEAMRAQK